MFSKLFAFILTMFVFSVMGQYIRHGECRTDAEVVQDFDFDKYMVKWFEIQRYDLQFQLNSECSQSRFDKAVDTSATVMNSWNMSKNRRRTYIHGTATLADPLADPQVGKLIVSFDRLQPGTSANYWILDTDYSNYSVVWYCYGIGNGNSAEVAWVLSRSTSLSPEVEEKVNLTVDKYLDRSQLRVTKQDLHTCGY